jgi:DNA-binding Lrp family transcriptional regulator
MDTVGLSREFLESEVWRSLSTEHKVVLITLMAMAPNYDVEFKTSLRAIQQKAGVSLKSVRTGIQKLERLGVVARQVAHQGSLLKLAGWLDCRLYTPPSGTPSGTQGAQQVAHQVAHPTDASNPDVDLIHTLSQAKAGTASGTLSGTPTKEKEKEKEKERSKEKEKEKEKEKYIYYSRQNSDESLPSNDVERLEQPANRVPVKEIIQAWNEVFARTPVPKVREITKARATWVKREWKKQRDGLGTVDDFKALFEYIRDDCVFIMRSFDEGRNWFSFNWLFKWENNFTKVLEGTYEQRKKSYRGL